MELKLYTQPTAVIHGNVNAEHGPQLVGPVPHSVMMVSLCAGRRSEAEAH